MRIATLLGGIFALLLSGNTAFSQQLKLGLNPYTVQKSALLELNSTNQGLLLARITDTSLINALTPPDGMVIYFTPTKQLMVRAGGAWQAFTVSGGAITSLNGLTAPVQTFATGTSGTDFNISSAGAVHTFSIPDASATARGLVTTGAQTFAGSKTFSSAPLFSSLTAGSVPYIGTSGLLSENNANLFWDASNIRLGVGTNTPSQKLDVKGTIVASATTYPNYAYNSANRMAFGESNVPANETGSVVQFGSGSNTRNMLFAFTKTNVNTSYFGNDGTQMMLGSEAAVPITFRTGLVYTSANVMSSGTERMRLTSTGNLGIGTSSPSTTLHVVGTNPLTLTGVQAGTSTSADSLLTITSGLVRKIPMSTFTTSGGDITSLNGLTATSQTFATGNAGADFNISSAGSVHTFNIPDASATARGAVTTGAQTIAGSKTFSSAPIFSSLTAGSIPYIGTGGLLSQNNASLFWDATNNRLGIGTNTPGSDFTLYQSTGATSKGFRFTGNSIGGTSSGTGFAMALGFNQTNNKQLWLGDADYMGNSSGTFVRYSTGNGQTILDAISGDNVTRRSIRIGFGNDALSTVILGDDGVATTPGSYVWDYSNMAIGSGYRSASAPSNGLLVQGNVGIGTTAPSTALHVVGTNPLTLTGVQAGTSTSADSLLTITSGLVRKIPTSTYASASNFWALGGNTVGSVKNFGTVDAFDLPFITGNTEKMRLSSAGNVAIGATSFNATNPEKFLVQAGVTSSFNLMQGRGKINNYLQINVQNDSAGTSASSDLVATSDNGNESVNFIDMGINSSANTSTGVIGGANNAYLYSTGNDFAIGNATASKSLLFFTGGTASEAMRINSSGQVGIGTTSPSTTLHVVGTNPLTLTGVQAGTSTSADSLLTITSGLVRKIPTSTYTSASNFWALGGNTVGALKNFGTVDAFDLPFITGNTERMRLSSTGNLGLGTSTFDGTAPEKLLISAGSTSSYNLVAAKGNRNGYLQFNIQNLSSQGQASTDIVATADNGTSKTSNYVNLGINGSGYNNGGGGILGTANTAYLYSVAQDFVIGNSAASKNLIFFTGGSATSNEAMRINGSGKVGIGTASPSTTLHVVGTNPLTLTGVQAGTSTSADSLLTITSGLVRKVPFTGTYWALGGNTVGSMKSLGTVDAFDLPFITNNTEKMRISSTGNVGIGTSSFDAVNPEKLLVQAGITSSFNLIEAHGKINNYLQLNIQNDSSGTNASSDVVATADNGDESNYFIDMGINSSGNTSTGVIGGANNAYLYTTGNDFAIGTGRSSKSLIFFTGGLATNERMRIDGSGNVGVGTSSPTAKLHLPAGTATASTAPLKLTSGTNLTTPEDGAVEYNGTNYFVTQGTTRYTLAKTLTATATLDFPSTGASSASTLTISVPGAVDGDAVSLGAPNAAASIGGANFSAYVSSAGVVTVKLYNSNVLTAIDPASGTYRVSVLRY